MLWSRLFLDYAIVAILFAVAYFTTPWLWPFVAVALGVMQHAIGELGHQAAHSKQNWAARLAFWPIGLSVVVYKQFHFAHHRWLGEPGKDPEVAIVQKFKKRWTEPYRWWDSVLDVLGLHVDESTHVMRQMSSGAVFVGYVVAVGVFAMAFGYIVLLWPLGALTGLMLAHRLRARTEHNHLTKPGVTLDSVAPTAKTFWFSPHGTWQHKEHHRK